jgi:hypothetical protein
MIMGEEDTHRTWILRLGIIIGWTTGWDTHTLHSSIYLTLQYLRLKIES